MADPSKGRGRGSALLLALNKTRKESPPQTVDPTPESTPGPSVAPSEVSGLSGATSTTVGGRGRMAALLLQKMQQKPGGGDTPIFSPASDVSPTPSAGPPKGAGRGVKLLQSLRATQVSRPGASQGDIAAVTQQMAASTVCESAVTSTSVAKNKYFREIKDTPPVVMKGQTGTPCEVTANFIHLRFKENAVYEYEVVYDPPVDHKNLRFRLLNEHRHFFKEKTFDGTTLYVPHMLPDEALNLVSTNKHDDSKVNVKIIFRRTRKLSEMIHIYNILFKQIMRDLKLIPFGRQYFNEHSAIQIPQHKLEVWPGYVTAVDEYEGGLMLTLDSTHRVLRTQSVLTFIKETIQKEGANWKKAVTEMLVGCSVMTTYNKKLFRVDTINDSMTPKSTFERTDKGQRVTVSFIDYYKSTYGIEIMDHNQPLLISKDTKLVAGNSSPTEFMICLVPELCQLTGLSDAQRNNFTLMKDVATYTRITPNQRHHAFKQYINNVLSCDEAKSRLDGWGLSIAPETINLTARTLPPEALFFGNNIKVPGKPTAEWNNEVTRNPVMTAVDLVRWIVVYTDRDRQVTNDFVDTVRRCAKPMGIIVEAPQMIRLQNDRTEAYVTGLKHNINPNLQIVVVICPTMRDDRYSAIKKICCNENPIPSQVINARTIGNQKKLRAITQKILLQMNCKLGGTLWGINIPIKTAMIVGIDSYHDASRKQRSVCSFVASYNQSMTHWFSKVVFQEKGQEVVDGLKSALVDSVRHYMNMNGCLPDRIIMYRDGVGDGQLKTIQNYEIPQMKLSLTLVDTKYTPSLTYVVVQKRINTRIFMKVGGGFDNPHPGTVVDHDITRRDWYDFLIASQKVNQGTVTPTHYVVVHDDSGMTPDQCQRLTYKMCHLYYNWPGTVRVPAPCQYAHKLAYLIGQNVHHEPHASLSDKLFFL